MACGDFNVAPTDDDVWDPAVFTGSTHVTPPERQALADLRALGLQDVVPTPMKGPHPFTYWDYRAGMFAKDKGMRIDLVQATEAVAARVRGAYVDREARKGKGPSDHAPVGSRPRLRSGPRQLRMRSALSSSTAVMTSAGRSSASSSDRHRPGVKNG